MGKGQIERAWSWSINIAQSTVAIKVFASLLVLISIRASESTG